MNAVALVPAAGLGTRLGAEIPKALVSVRGESLLRRAVRGLLESDRVAQVIVAHPGRELSGEAAAEQARAFSEELAPFGSRVQLIPGGILRSDSVRLMLAQALSAFPELDTVLVHDAARAFTPPELIASVVQAVEAGAPAVIPVLPVTDTVKRVETLGDSAAENVQYTVDRAPLRAVQTPQGFAAGVLREAYGLSSGVSMAGREATDDAELVERHGYSVRTIRGHAYALKITTAFDLEIAESVLAARAGAREPAATDLRQHSGQEAS